ncbi:hypothetical protein H5410_005430 [Solanum commersonii]|uniref:Uncharacterized protein n=1 Tax=Solanum commersonii TaxID=4109 RepID=A0A9J6A7J2_SOLCO|nr:hypothetical protein H5410_005430 [Solanum commersonii]
MKSVGPEGQKGAFSSLNEPQRFRLVFGQKFSRTSVKTLLIDSVCPRGKRVHLKVQTSPKTSIKRLLAESVSPEGQRGAFPSSNEPQSWKNQILSIFVCYSPWIFGDLGFRLLVPRGKHVHFEVRTNPKARKTKFYRCLCAIVHGFFVIRNIGFLLPKFLWMSVKTLLMDSVYLNWKMGVFSSSHEPQSWKNQILPILVCYNLVNGVSWSRRANRCILKFKQPPKQEKLDFANFSVLYSPWIFGDLGLWLVFG